MQENWIKSVISQFSIKNPVLWTHFARDCIYTDCIYIIHSNDSYYAAPHKPTAIGPAFQKFSYFIYTTKVVRWIEYIILFWECFYKYLSYKNFKIVLFHFTILKPKLILSPLSANPTKWSNTPNELFGCVWPFCGVGA